MRKVWNSCAPKPRLRSGFLRLLNGGRNRKAETARLCDDHIDKPGLSSLILLRHGQSTWNATPTFTGWCDIPLTQRGVHQAKASGELLRERGLADIDVAYTSTLQRAIITCETALQHAQASATPVTTAWQLNERHYGALQGFRKDDPGVLARYGRTNLAAWRREYSAAPPALDEGHRYYQEPPAPRTESLEDCQTRVLAYWRAAILPSLMAPGRRVLLVAHSNTLRGLIGHLDRVPAEKIPHVHVPNSVPCVYQFDPAAGGAVVSPLLDTPAGGSRGRWVLSAENHRRLRGKIGGSGSFARSVFEAWDLDGNGELDRCEIEAGLRGLVGGSNIAVSALAGKMLEEMDEDGSRTLDLGEFETLALETCRKFIPGLLEDGPDDV